MSKPKGTLYIISAASGTGKTSLANAVKEADDNVVISVSHTTRSLKNNEIPNKNYFFVDKQTFEKMIAQQKFLEYAKIYDDYYGTSEGWVREQLLSGKDVILDIDWQGAAQIRDKMPCVSIFLLPPSQEELRHRLEARQRDDAGSIRRRLAEAGNEIFHYHEFDYLIINDDFQRAKEEVLTIIRAQRLSVAYQKICCDQLLLELLS